MCVSLSSLPNYYFVSEVLIIIGRTQDGLSPSETHQFIHAAMGFAVISAEGRSDRSTHPTMIDFMESVVYLFGRLTLMCSSRSCLVDASEGAPIKRSIACWFIGNSEISRRLVVPHRSMTMRSRPAAMPPCGGARYWKAGDKRTKPAR